MTSPIDHGENFFNCPTMRNRSACDMDLQKVKAVQRVKKRAFSDICRNLQKKEQDQNLHANLDQITNLSELTPQKIYNVIMFLERNSLNLQSDSELKSIAIKLKQLSLNYISRVTSLSKNQIQGNYYLIAQSIVRFFDFLENLSDPDESPSDLDATFTRLRKNMLKSLLPLGISQNNLNPSDNPSRHAIFDKIREDLIPRGVELDQRGVLEEEDWTDSDEELSPPTFNQYLSDNPPHHAIFAKIREDLIQRGVELDQVDDTEGWENSTEELPPPTFDQFLSDNPPPPPKSPLTVGLDRYLSDNLLPPPALPPAVGLRQLEAIQEEDESDLDRDEDESKNEGISEIHNLPPLRVTAEVPAQRGDCFVANSNQEKADQKDLNEDTRQSWRNIAIPGLVGLLGLSVATLIKRRSSAQEFFKQGYDLVQGLNVPSIESTAEAVSNVIKTTFPSIAMYSSSQTVIFGASFLTGLGIVYIGNKKFS